MNQSARAIILQGENPVLQDGRESDNPDLYIG